PGAPVVIPVPQPQTVTLHRATPMAAGANPSAREIFYGSSPAKLGLLGGGAPLQRSAKLSTPRVPFSYGIRYTISRRGDDGGYAVVDPATVFHRDDSIRLTLESNINGLVSISDGEGVQEKIAVLAHTKYTVPSAGAIELGR